MRYHSYCALIGAAWLGTGVVAAQVTLNPNPSRVVGHARLELRSANPNLVEGRELYSPQGIAVDTSAEPPILYVSDTGNNRILGWRNAAQFASGAPADLIIGQQDKYSTLAQGPGTSFSAGLNSPTGLAVKNGDLYVADTANNRILRFPRPMSQTDQFPNLVLGQPGFTTRSANQGGLYPTARTLALATGSTAYRTGLAFDGAGNLWVADAGNNRVLRYPSSALSSNGSAANMVLGQLDFISVGTVLSATSENMQVKDRFRTPSGVAFDAKGRLYVSDGLGRVLVFEPTFYSSKPARRIMGVMVAKEGESISQMTLDRTTLYGPEGVFLVDGTTPAVNDCYNHRILFFAPYEEWPEETATFSPMAKSVLGQLGDFTNKKSNNGRPEPSADTLSLPVAAVFAAGELFVVDSGNHRVLVLPRQSGVFAAATRVLGQEQFAFRSPNLIEGREFDFLSQTSKGTAVDAGLAVDYTSDPPRLYVADTYNNRVLGFRDARKVRPGDRADIVIGQPDMFRALCNYPDNDAEKPNEKGLCSPTGLVVDTEGNLWVADSGNGRVLRFPAPFAHQATLPAADMVLGQSGFTAKITDPTQRTMAAPYGLAFAGDRGLLVSDVTHNRVLFFPKVEGSFTSGMAAAKVFGQPNFTSAASSSSSAEDNRMNGPRHISTDTDDRAYVADTGNGRVLIFDILVNAPSADAHAAVILTGLRNPRAVYVSPQTGEIWVTDTNSAQSLRYPRFDQLAWKGFEPNGGVPAGSVTVALTQDQYGNLYVADATSRVAIHYPGITAMNGASFLASRALAPGMVAALYPLGNQFGQETSSADDRPNPRPLPAELADIEVLVNDQPAPLFFVSPSQINLQVPSGTPTSGTAEFQVTKKSTGQILGSASVAMNSVAPGLFTLNGTGAGQVMANNADGSANSPTNPAARGTVISLFGTGQGLVTGAPADGHAAESKASTSDMPRVFIGTCWLDDAACTGDAAPHVLYSGLAPGMVGVWQIDVKIPMVTAPESSVLVLMMYRSIYTSEPKRNITTIAVKQ